MLASCRLLSLLNMSGIMNSFREFYFRVDRTSGGVVSDHVSRVTRSELENCEPSSLLAREYAAALLIVTQGGFLVLPWELRVGRQELQVPIRH